MFRIAGVVQSQTAVVVEHMGFVFLAARQFPEQPAQSRASDNGGQRLVSLQLRSG